MPRLRSLDALAKTISARRGNLGGRGSRQAGFINLDGGDYRHPRSQAVLLDLLQIVEDNLDRHPLYDLYVVSGRVLGRQKAEAGTAAALHTIDMGRELHFGVRIDGDDRRLARAACWPTAFP